MPATCNARKITATAVDMWITRWREFPHIPTAQQQPKFLQKSDGRPITVLQGLAKRAYFSSSNSALASFRSGVSKPSVKEIFSGRPLAEPSLKFGHAAIFGDVEKPSERCRLIGHDIVTGFYRPLPWVGPKIWRERSRNAAITWPGRKC